MEDFIKILSNISGYSVKELKERNTDPIIQPEDCLEAMKKAINYTRCCKSDSELLQTFKKDDLVMLDENVQVRVIIPEPKILISEDLGGAKMWVETHRCIKK